MLEACTAAAVVGVVSLEAMAQWTPANVYTIIPGQQLTWQANNNAVLLHRTFCSSENDQRLPDRGNHAATWT